VALRVYFALLSGAGLVLAMLAWRRVRGTRAPALAGALFAGLWLAEFYGPQVMPNLWIALSGLAAVGCFLCAVRDRTARGPLVGLGLALAVAALMRPSDALFLAAPLLLGVLVVPRWRSVSVLLAGLAGLAVGGAEWVIEAYLRFGGPGPRLHLSSLNEGGFGLHWAVGAELRSLNGPTLCRPCTVGWHHPWLTVWWPALPLLVLGGVVVRARAHRWAEALLPALCGLSAAVPYLFLIDYAAPRFLLPSYALLAIPVADLLAWLAVRSRPWLLAVLAAVLAAQFLGQLLILAHTARSDTADHADYTRVATELRRLGLRDRCLLTGNDAEPLAYYTGCAAAETIGVDTSATPAQIVRRAAQEPTALLLYPGESPPSYARDWRAHSVPGLAHRQSYVAFLPPATSTRGMRAPELGRAAWVHGRDGVRR
jgi:hypothetical protein